MTDFNVQTFLITNMDHITEDNTKLLTDFTSESKRMMDKLTHEHKGMVDKLRKLPCDNETYAAEIVKVMDTHLQQV